MRNILQAITGLFRGGASAVQATGPRPGREHAVIVTFPWQHAEADEIYALEDRLIQAIDAAGAGEFDGNELAVDKSDARLYMYGPDADKLFEAIEPELRTSSFTTGMRALVRYGPPEDGTPERTVEFGPAG